MGLRIPYAFEQQHLRENSLIDTDPLGFGNCHANGKRIEKPLDQPWITTDTGSGCHEWGEAIGCVELTDQFRGEFIVERLHECAVNALALPGLTELGTDL